MAPRPWRGAFLRLVPLPAPYLRRKCADFPPFLGISTAESGPFDSNQRLPLQAITSRRPEACAGTIRACRRRASQDARKPLPSLTIPCSLLTGSPRLPSVFLISDFSMSNPFHPLLEAKADGVPPPAEPMVPLQKKPPLRQGGVGGTKRVSSARLWANIV